MVDSVEGDVEDVGRRGTGRRGWRKKRLALAAEADSESSGWFAEAFAEDDVFNDDAERSEVEQTIEGRARGAVCVV